MSNNDYDHFIRITFNNDETFFKVFDEINSKNSVFTFTAIKLIEGDINTGTITFTGLTQGKPWDMINNWEAFPSRTSMFNLRPEQLGHISELHIVYNSTKYNNCGELHSFYADGDPTTNGGNKVQYTSSWGHMYSANDTTETIIEDIYVKVAKCDAVETSNMEKLGDIRPITLGDGVVAAFFSDIEYLEG